MQGRKGGTKTALDGLVVAYTLNKKRWILPKGNRITLLSAWRPFCFQIIASIKNWGLTWAFAVI
jgi:hypothetical protein